MRGFLKGLVLSTFLSTHEEWHALLEGFGEGFCITLHHVEPSAELLTDLEGEHHYYAAGRACGRACLILLVGGVVAFIVRVA